MASVGTSHASPLTASLVPALLASERGCHSALEKGPNPDCLRPPSPGCQDSRGKDHGCQQLLMNQNAHYTHHTCHVQRGADGVGRSVNIKSRSKTINQHIPTQACLTPLQRAPSKLVRNLGLPEQRALIRLQRAVTRGSPPPVLSAVPGGFEETGMRVPVPQTSIFHLLSSPKVPL